jgi:nucleotide-binding universal stress UspA family protein
MSILCGVDFSESAANAATVAARLAARTREPLHLLHALQAPAEDLHPGRENGAASVAQGRLAREAERLRALGADVWTHVASGPAHEALRQNAQALSARLIVVGAVGQSKSGRGLGEHADQAAQRAHVPVLVVRDPTLFDAWLAKTRPLKILLGVDASSSSENAARWIGELRSIGPCEVLVAHLYWPPGEFSRVGLGGLRSYVDPDTEITQTFEREYSKRFGGLLGAGSHEYRIEPHLGRIGDALASLANQEKADLVVVGCHDHSLLSLVWEGSVARRVLECASTSVVCAPAPARPASVHTPILSHVLAATDFSRQGDASVRLAYSIVNHGGTVHLVHVVKATHVPTEPYDIFGPAPSAALADVENAARSRLTDCIPRDAGSVAALTRVHVLFADNAAKAICQAAERLGADVLCVGTHGRTGVSKAVLGSVASEVVEKTTRPVLLARAPRD